MGFRIRELHAECKFSSALSLDALSRAIPADAVTTVLDTYGVCEQRERKFTMRAVLWLVIALNLYPTLAASAVLRKVARGLRFIWSDPSYVLPSDGAITYRRYQLGAQPVVALFQQVCQPIATPQTPAAFLWGLRLMALDGTVEAVPDTPATAAVFGRHPGPRGASAFPQVQGVYLVECGTHAIVDAGFWPCATSERVGGRRVLRSVTRGMLVLWDRGFHDFDMFVQVRQRGGHVLSRLPAHVKPQHLRTLADGSYLAYLYPSEYQRRKRGDRLLLRVVEYTLTDPALPGYGLRYRVGTTLLNPRVAPAVEIACAYHERWEIEVVIDELDPHQRLSMRTLRSLKPVGVIQELYGLLLAHYAIRVLMHEAALRVDLDPDRLSFVHALEVIRDAIPEFQMTVPEQWPALYTRLLTDLVAKRVPARRPRSNPRVVKRKMSNFPLKRPEHYRPPRPTGAFRDAVAVQQTAPLHGEQIADQTKIVLELSVVWRHRGTTYLDLRQPELCLI